MIIPREIQSSARSVQATSSSGWKAAGSWMRLSLVLASLTAFVLGQLIFDRGFLSQTPDIFVVKQVDAEEVKLKEDGKNQHDFAVVADSFSSLSVKEQFPVFAGQTGFLFERLLCLGSRGPPNG